MDRGACRTVSETFSFCSSVESSVCASFLQPLFELSVEVGLGIQRLDSIIYLFYGDDAYASRSLVILCLC